ncbi:MAG: nuclease domain-containing protein, partial [Bacteroidota bacterium]
PQSLWALSKVTHPNTLANQRAKEAMRKVLFQLGQPEKWLNPLMPAKAKQRWVLAAQRWRRRMAAATAREPWRTVSGLSHKPVQELPPAYQRFESQALALFNDLGLAQSQTSRYRWHDTPLLYEQWVFWYLIQFLARLPGAKPLPPANPLIQTNSGNKEGFLFRRGAYLEFELAEQEEQVGIWYNRNFGSSLPEIPSARPDIVLERWRRGQRVPLRWLLEVKYQVKMEDGVEGPPRSAFAQLHRYRDAAVSDLSWENDMRTAVKAQGGLVIFPGEVSEAQGRDRYWYKSLAQMGIGAMPLRPGAYRDRTLFEDWFKQWLGLPQSKLWEQRIEYKTNP